MTARTVRVPVAFLRRLAAFAWDDIYTDASECRGSVERLQGALQRAGRYAGGDGSHPAGASRVRCATCGGSSVELVEWIDPNANEINDSSPFVDDLAAAAVLGQTFCQDCGSNEPLEFVSA